MSMPEGGAGGEEADPTGTDSTMKGDCCPNSKFRPCASSALEVESFWKRLRMEKPMAGVVGEVTVTRVDSNESNK